MPLLSLPTALEPDAESPTRRMLARLRLGFVILAAICTTIAVLLTVATGGELRINLLYSFAVGFCSWFTIDVARTLTGWAVDLWRARRGLAPVPGGYATGWSVILPLVVLGLLVGPLVGYTIADAITGRSTASMLPLVPAPSALVLVVTVVGTMAAIVVLALLERLAQARRQALTAERAALEFRLKLLESQLEPHMLFNTLANLRVLIETEPTAAQAMLDRLIAFLRATLAGSRAAWHPLGAEFERLSDYLALMTVRMGSRLDVVLDLPDDLRDLRVPPLLLQPLVENAIRHGLEPKVGPGRLEVRARRDGGRLELSVRDTGLGLAPVSTPRMRRNAAGDGGGFGLEQVRSRLRALYGDAASFSLAPAAPEGALATIVMPARERTP